MLEIQFLGRGGQGAVLASSMLATALFHEGKYSQAFPSFGVERRGAPVKSFCRVSENPIILHQEVYEPGFLIVLDSSLINSMDVFKGVKKDGTVIINSTRTSKELKIKNNMKVYNIDATSIALETMGIPIVNTAMLGAFSKVTNIVKLDSLIEAINEKFKGSLAEKNILAVKRCYKEMKV